MYNSRWYIKAYSELKFVCIDLFLIQIKNKRFHCVIIKIHVKIT